MRLVHWLRSLWSNLIYRRRVEDSLDDELQSYRDLSLRIPARLSEDG